MRLVLDVDDVRDEFEDLTVTSLAFKHFKPNVQAAIRAAGVGYLGFIEIKPPNQDARRKFNNPRGYR